MTRWVLYTLILLNLLAFLWFYSHSTDDSPKNSVTAPELLNSNRIKLVKAGEKKVTSTVPEKEVSPEKFAAPSVSTETNLAEAGQLVANANPQLVETLTTGEPEDKVERKILKPITKSIIEKQPLPKIQKIKPDVTKTTKPRIIETKQVESKPTEKAPGDQSASKEKDLLAEMLAFSSNSSQSVGFINPQDYLCYQYGPLTTNQSEQITKAMDEQDIPVIEQKRVVVEKRGFLVLIMPQADAAGAKRQMRIARKAGLDAFTITKGDWIHGVSLGIFSGKNNAGTLFSKANKLIPQAEVAIQDRLRERDVYRLIFKLQKDQDPVQLLSSNSFPAFDLKDPLEKSTKVAKKSCETVEF